MFRKYRQSYFFSSSDENVQKSSGSFTVYPSPPIRLPSHARNVELSVSRVHMWNAIPNISVTKANNTIWYSKNVTTSYTHADFETDGSAFKQHKIVFPDGLYNIDEINDLITKTLQNDGNAGDAIQFIPNYSTGKIDCRIIGAGYRVVFEEGYSPMALLGFTPDNVQLGVPVLSTNMVASVVDVTGFNDGTYNNVDADDASGTQISGPLLFDIVISGGSITDIQLVSNAANKDVWVGQSLFFNPSGNFTGAGKTAQLIIQASDLDSTHSFQGYYIPNDSSGKHFDNTNWEWNSSPADTTNYTAPTKAVMASFDSLVIRCPQLVTDTYMNGSVGDTLTQFRITDTAIGSNFLWEPINPDVIQCKSLLHGTPINSLTFTMVDDTLFKEVDTAGYDWGLTLLITFELDLDEPEVHANPLRPMQRHDTTGNNGSQQGGRRRI